MQETGQESVRIEGSLSLRSEMPDVSSANYAAAIERCESGA